MIDPATFGNTIDGVPILITCEFEGTGEKIPWDGTSDTIAVALEAVRLTGNLTVGATLTPNPVYLTDRGELHDAADGGSPVTELVWVCNVTNQDSSHPLNSLNVEIPRGQLTSTGLFGGMRASVELLPGTDELTSGHRLSKRGRLNVTNPAGARIGTHYLDITFKGTSDDAAGTIEEIAHVDLVIERAVVSQPPIPPVPPVPTPPTAGGVSAVITNPKNTRILKKFTVKFKVKNDTDDDATLSGVSFSANKRPFMRGQVNFGVEGSEPVGDSVENVVVHAHSETGEFRYRITLNRKPETDESMDLYVIPEIRT